MKTIVAAAALALFLPAISLAATLNFPSDEPVAAITIPDNWQPTETESGIEAVSEDQAIYLSIDVAEAETTDQVIDDVFAFLENNGVTIDASTQKQSEDKFNGMEMTNFDWSGTDAEGEVSIGVSLVSPKPDTLLIITYWGTKGMQEQHGPELLEIINSLKPAE